MFCRCCCCCCSYDNCVDGGLNAGVTVICVYGEYSVRVYRCCDWVLCWILWVCCVVVFVIICFKLLVGSCVCQKFVWLLIQEGILLLWVTVLKIVFMYLYIFFLLLSLLLLRLYCASQVCVFVVLQIIFVVIMICFGVLICLLF